MRKVFYSLIIIFLLIIGYFVFLQEYFAIVGILEFLFFALGLYFIYLVKKSEKKHKFYLYLTGIASSSILPAVILHNFVYAFFEYLKPGFWGQGDEPFFFIVAIIIAPVCFTVGVIGSLVKGID